MASFVKCFGSNNKQDDCIFCGKPVMEFDVAQRWQRDGRSRVVHSGCPPRCAEYGEELVTVRGSFVFRPEVKDGDVVKRMSPCWALTGDDQTVCAYHRWLKTAKPGDAWL